MQTSKLFLVTVAATAITCVGQVPPHETEAQAKAREALRQKMEQLGEQPAPAAPVVAPRAPVAPPVPVRPPTPAPAPVIKPAPVAPPPAEAPVAPLVVVPREDDEATIRAREAVREKIAELNAASAGTKSRWRILGRSAAAPSSGFAPVPPPSEPGAAKQAMQAKVEALQPAPTPAAPVVAAPSPAPKPKPPVPVVVTEPVTTAPPVEVTKPAPPKPAKAKPVKPAALVSEYAPLEPPPSALPASKEARLAELLRQYRSDEISPAAYHAERARILAEP